MDPNACLQRIAGHLASTESGETASEELDFACLDLFEWIDGGGFEPDWTPHELATSYYRTMAVQFRRGEFPTDTSGD